MKIEDVIFMPEGEVIGREIVSATFEEWITHVFDRPHTERHWRWNEDYVGWAAPASETVAFLNKTFEESGTLLRQFSDHQVNDGLWYVFCESLSEISSTLWNESVPPADRKQTVRSMRKLYSYCFGVRCAPLLSHLVEPKQSPLNSACFMWWDLLPRERWTNHAANREIDMECLAVMVFALGIKSDACRESALHGLGHWQSSYPEFVQAAIDHFMTITPDANPELVAYALKAREGKVL